MHSWRITKAQRVKSVSTKAPNKFAQSLTPPFLGGSARTPADAAPLQVEKIRVLRPPHGVEGRSIAPSHGVGRTVTAPSPGAIEGDFYPLSTPPDGDHLEKPSVVSFESMTRANGAGQSQQVGRDGSVAMTQTSKPSFEGFLLGVSFL